MSITLNNSEYIGGIDVEYSWLYLYTLYQRILYDNIDILKIVSNTVNTLAIYLSIHLIIVSSLVYLAIG